MTPQMEFYLLWLYEHNRNPTSIKTTRSVLGSCLRMLADGGHPTDALAIRPDDYFWLARKVMEDGSEYKARTYIHTLSTFVKRHGGHDAENIGLMWNRTIPNPARITMEDFRTLYDSADGTDRLILALGGAMGLRREEIARIRIRDITKDGILIHGKGHGTTGKVAVQPMPELVRSLVCVYVCDRAEPDDFLVRFPTLRNPDSERARNDAVNRHIGKMSEIIGKRVTPHALRRLFATSLDRQGVPIATICDLMRHTSPDTTKRYIEQDTERMAAAAEELGSRIAEIVVSS